MPQIPGLSEEAQGLLVSTIQFDYVRLVDEWVETQTAATRAMEAAQRLQRNANAVRDRLMAVIIFLEAYTDETYDRPKEPDEIP